MSTYKEYGEFLEDKGIRASSQRILMLEYLNENMTHPTADKIYIDLSTKLPSISKATVYNNLKLFVEKGILKEVSIDNTEVHYDIVTESHGHFLCVECKKIKDFVVRDIAPECKELDNDQIISKDIFFRGICSDCQSKRNN